MSTLTCTVTRGVTLANDASGKCQFTKDRGNLLGKPTVTLALSGAVATADIAADAVTVAKLSDALSDLIHAAPTFVIGDEAAQGITVEVTLNDAKGEALSEVGYIKWWLSDAAGGAVTGTAPDGAITYVKGAQMLEHTAKSFEDAITNATGELDLKWIESGAGTWYLNIMLGGKVFSSGAITFA